MRYSRILHSTHKYDFSASLVMCVVLKMKHTVQLNAEPISLTLSGYSLLLKSSMKAVSWLPPRPIQQGGIGLLFCKEDDIST